MNVETDDMRLQFLKDFGFTDATFSDTTHGTTAKITALLRNENREVEDEGEVGVEAAGQEAAQVLRALTLHEGLLVVLAHAAGYWRFGDGLGGAGRHAHGGEVREGF